MFKLLLLFLFGLSALGVNGHMQMSNPLPARSPLGNGPGEKASDYTKPLSTDGSDFPCKGYHNDPFNSVATYKAGGQYEMTIAGSLPYGGGSCQLSLSYDNGKSFNVIKSMIGGCPLKTSYEFTIPEKAPSGNALFAWTWFNRIGNREMYMNCAQVTIEGGSSDISALNSLPDIFVANTGNPECHTISDTDVIFPDPGKNVEYGGDAAAGGKPGFTCRDNSDSPVSLGSSSAQGQAASKQTEQAAAWTSPMTPTAPPTEMPRTATQSTPQGSNGSEQVNHNTNCTAGTIRCDSKTTFSLCVESTFIFIGNVAAETVCQNGVIGYP